MRKFLLTMAVLAGAGIASGAHATPRLLPLAAPAADGTTLAQPVQYYEDWRYREFRRRQAYERFRRFEARREWRREHGYGPRYGYGYGGGYGGSYGGGYGGYRPY